MILSHKNCTIQISEDKIECEYLFLANKTIHWELFLNEKLQFEKIILDPEEIREFQFEIFDITRKGWFLTQEAIVYYLKKNEKEPEEFFRLCVIEEPQLSSKTKSYEFANEILKVISHKYNIPFSFKYDIETKQKRKNLNIGCIVIMIIWFIFFLAVKLR